MKNSNKKDYVSIIYDVDRIPKTDYPRQFVKYLINRFNLQRDHKLLEVGCGRGDFLIEFQNAGLQCVGIDRENSAVEMNPHLEVYKCDITSEKFPFNDSSIDVVYHKSVIEHVYDPANLMDETLRVLKPGGKLIILTPDWHTQWRNFFEDFTHSRPYDVLAISDLLKIYGFNNLTVERFYQLPIIWKFPLIKFFSRILQLVFNVYGGRWLTEKTGIKFFRWSTELMILGYGETKENK